MFRIEYIGHNTDYLTVMLADKRREIETIKHHEYISEDAKECLIDELMVDIETIEAILSKRESEKSCQQLE